MTTTFPLIERQFFWYRHRSDFKAEPELIIDSDDVRCANDQLNTSDSTVENLKSKGDRVTCSVCGKHFNHLSNLVRHLRIHQNLKPYVCDQENCGKTFRDSTALLVHKRSHSGVLLSKSFVSNKHCG